MAAWREGIVRRGRTTSEGLLVTRAFLFCLSLLAACGRTKSPAGPDDSGAKVAAVVSASPAPPGASATATSSASSVAAPSAKNSTLVVAWGKAPSGELESFLLEWTGERVEVRGKKAGAIVVAGGGFYRWRETTGKGQGLNDCDEAFNPGDKPRPNNHFTFDIKGAKAERLDAPGEVEIESIPELEDMAVYSNTVTFEGSLGPYLFVSNSQDSRHCLAAHDGGGTTYWVFDLEKRKGADFPSKSDEAELRAAAKALPDDKTKPCADAVRESGTTDPASIDSMSLESILPKWTKDGALSLELGFTIMLSYAGGRHDCGLEVSRLPPSLAPFEPPAWLKQRPKKLDALELKGWSAVPSSEPSARDAANRVFKVRPSTAPAASQ